MSSTDVPGMSPQTVSTGRFPSNSAHHLPNGTPPVASWASKYRGVGAVSPSHLPTLMLTFQATVEDLDPPPALSTTPDTLILSALLSAYERDFSHLTVLHPSTRSLVGYLSIPRLRNLLSNGTVSETDHVQKAMQRFRRKGRKYKVITAETELEELEAFFEGRTEAGSPEEAADSGQSGEKQDFAVVTDGARKFVLGVVTRGDLEEFVRRRPG